MSGQQSHRIMPGKISYGQGLFESLGLRTGDVKGSSLSSDSDEESFDSLSSFWPWRGLGLDPRGLWILGLVGSSFLSKVVILSISAMTRVLVRSWILRMRLRGICSEQPLRGPPLLTVM